MEKNPVKKANQEDWHPADVIAALRKKGITLRSIAEKAGLASGSSTLSAALVRSLPANEKRIAEALGIHPMAIWPSRYNSDGSIKPRGFRAVQFSARENARNGKALADADQNAVAA